MNAGKMAMIDRAAVCRIPAPRTRRANARRSKAHASAAVTQPATEIIVFRVELIGFAPKL
jgi:hypothetical protein